MNTTIYLDSIKEFILINRQRVGVYRGNRKLYNIYEEVREENHINSSTIFLMSSRDTWIILLCMDIDKKMKSVEQSLDTKDQHTSIVKGKN